MSFQTLRSRFYSLYVIHDYDLFLIGYHRRIVEGIDRFEDLARKYSDCSSAKRGGDLGTFTRGTVTSIFHVRKNFFHGFMVRSNV